MAIKVPEVMFYHKTRERLCVAQRAHMRLIKNKFSLSGECETIDACKHLFREFLEQIINGNYILSSEKLSEEDLDEYYKSSDFDWKDRNLFSKLYAKFDIE